MDQIFKGLSKLDLFGQSIPLNINKEPVYTSSLGGISSLSMVGILIVFFYSNLISFFNKTNLLYDQQTIFETDPSRMILTADSYMAALSIQQANFSTNPYFNITVMQKVYIRYDNGTQSTQTKYLPLEQCTLDHFQPIFTKQDINFTDQFNLLGLNKWLCFNKNYSIQLNGTYSSPVFEFLKIVVTDCVNGSLNSWSPTCAGQDQLDTYLNGQGQFKLQYYSTNNIINPSKPKDYIDTYLDDAMYFTFVPKQLSRQANIFYRKYNIKNDNSLIPISIWENIQLNVRSDSDYRDLTEIGRKTDNSYAIIYIRRSNFSEFIIRSYQKIGDLLSYLGGFLQFMIIVCGLIIAFYNRIQMMVELSNKLFDFNKQEEDQEVLDQSQHLSSRENASKVHDSNIPISLNKSVESSFQKDEHEIKNDSQEFMFKSIMISLKNKFNPILFNFRLFINQLTGNKLLKSNNTEKFNKAINRIYDELEVTNVVRKLNDVETLKYLVLNHNQQALMSAVPKIQLDNEQLLHREKLQFYDFLHHKQNLKECLYLFNQIYQAYELICEELDDLNLPQMQLEMNFKVLELMGSEFRQQLRQNRSRPILQQ